MNAVAELRPTPMIPEGLEILRQIACLASREDRDKLIALMATLPQIDLPLVHNFSVGVYARQIFMPAGSLVIGKLHATEHLNIISTGTVSVWTEQAGMMVYRGPWTFNSVAGTRKYLYVHEDTVWTTIHVTDNTDIEQLERDLIITDPLLPEGSI